MASYSTLVETSFPNVAEGIEKVEVYLFLTISQKNGSCKVNLPDSVPFVTGNRLSTV